MTNGNDAAMPTDVWSEALMGEPYQAGTKPGLTKREHFAAMAMSGILARAESSGYFEDISDAVRYADALIAALNE